MHQPYLGDADHISDPLIFRERFQRHRKQNVFLLVDHFLHGVEGGAVRRLTRLGFQSAVVCWVLLETLPQVLKQASNIVVLGPHYL